MKCSVENCVINAGNKIYCRKHLNRLKKFGDINIVVRKKIQKKCSIIGCEFNIKAKKLCRLHYERWKKNGDANYICIKTNQKNNKCKIETCNNLCYTKNICSKHYYRLYNYGDFVTVKNSRKYILNEAFFNHKSIELNWFLGWLVTDGNISKKNAAISFELKDKEPLEIFNKLISNNTKIINTRKQKYYKIIYNSKNLKDKLNKMGIRPAKTFNVEIPDISLNYLPHFVRGCIEGDGSIIIRNKNKLAPNLIVTLVSGSISFITELQNLIPFESKIIKPKNRNYYILVFYGRNAKFLCNWIYKDSKDLRLTRKYNKFLEYLNLRKNYRFKYKNYIP